MSAIVSRVNAITYEFPPKIYLATPPGLPAAGAYTTTPAFVLPVFGIREVTAWCTYTRGAANGQAAFRVSFDDLAGGTPEDGNDVVLDQTLAVAQPFDNQSFYKQTLYGPVPQDANPITFALGILVPRGATRVRILAAEIGVPATPGTLAIVLAGGT
jgi:hypothetical protein